MDKNFKRYNEDIEKYNAVAVDIVKKYKFEVNDLYKISKELPEEAHSDPVHYGTSIGTKAFTNAVLSHLCAALEIGTVEYSEDLNKEKPNGI